MEQLDRVGHFFVGEQLRVQETRERIPVAAFNSAAEALESPVPFSNGEASCVMIVPFEAVGLQLCFSRTVWQDRHTVLSKLLQDERSEICRSLHDSVPLVPFNKGR